jgi:hypothetical protein
VSHVFFNKFILTLPDFAQIIAVYKSPAIMSSSTTSILSAKARAATSAILRGIDGSNISTALQPYFPTLRSLLFGAAPPFLGGASLYALFQRYKQDQFKIEQLAWYVSYIVQQSEGFAEIMDTPALVIEALESVMDNAIENNEVSEREGERALKTLRKRVWSEHEEEIQGDKVMGQKPQDRIVRPVKRKRLNNGRVGEIVSTSPETGYQRREYEVQSGLGLKKMKNTRTRKEKVQIVHKSNDNNSMLQGKCFISNFALIAYRNSSL